MRRRRKPSVDGLLLCSGEAASSSQSLLRRRCGSSAGYSGGAAGDKRSRGLKACLTDGSGSRVAAFQPRARRAGPSAYDASMVCVFAHVEGRVRNACLPARLALQTSPRLLLGNVAHSGASTVQSVGRLGMSYALDAADTLWLPDGSCERCLSWRIAGTFKEELDWYA